MRYARSLIVTARKLVAARGRPSASQLDRALSTAYYAVFSAICFRISSALCGGRTGDRVATWDRVYRSIDHLGLQRALLAQTHAPSWAALGKTFATLQDLRHSADYDPGFVSTKDDALDAIAEADRALNQVADLSDDAWLAFAVRLLVKTRDRP